jgi:hypothetical protein
MAKYLSFTTGVGTELVNAGAISLVRLASATSVEMYELTGAKYFKLTTVGATQPFVDSINAALQQAAETSWQNSVIAVQNTGVTSITSVTVV